MRRFDYSFLKNGTVPVDFLNLVTNIEVIRTKIISRMENSSGIFEGLEKIAKVRSVKSSNEIEGIVTTDSRIMEIVNDRSEPKGHDECEIAGYRDALERIHTGYGTMKIDSVTILELHRIVMSYSETAGGRYKEFDNAVVDIDTEGRRHLRFMPVASELTDGCMEQLILAFNEARNDPKVNQMLLIPCFILDFLCIHPFSDGNGRVSRLLSLLLMYQIGLDVGKYISFEEKISISKNDYYDALERSSQKWHENGNDYIPFMKHFIDMLYLCYKDLDRRFAIVGDRDCSKKDRVEAVIVNSILPVSKREILEYMPDISARTVETALADLLKSGKIEKIGTYRNARYARKRTESRT